MSGIGHHKLFLHQGAIDLAIDVYARIVYTKFSQNMFCRPINR